MRNWRLFYRAEIKLLRCAILCAPGIRTAERELVELNQNEPVAGYILQYFNRNERPVFTCSLLLS